MQGTVKETVERCAGTAEGCAGDSEGDCRAVRRERQRNAEGTAEQCAGDGGWDSEVMHKGGRALRGELRTMERCAGAGEALCRGRRMRQWSDVQMSGTRSRGLRNGAWGIAESVLHAGRAIVQCRSGERIWGRQKRALQKSNVWRDSVDERRSVRRLRR